ncbi:hypothetical protein TSAR_013794 [Trichomalopsis sarcophagae]|uniref:PID domain-containing protein n=1 Tax=Trichomalopsis sarcophagae TaxID=543379 RepID=A0A232FBP8_9HYME|nr:hypothetical protein TSAR_013794 [Trichomalopsis sarcophagae]
MGNQPSADQPFKRATSYGNNIRLSKREKSPGKRMDRLRRSFRDSFRRRKDTPESNKPHQWQADEYAVRSSTCAFDVKYLGCVEVNSQKGIQTCEEALKILRNSRRRPIRAELHISGDGLRVVEHKTKGLIVDQIIEGVSFCAFDRNHEKGFSYICRDSTATRWMCHGFLALKESGKRLNHAVGCAFYASQERKQRREKDYAVTVKFDQRTSAFTRTGSFRQPSLAERQPDSRERAIDVLPARQVHNPFAIERPHASPLLLERQGSFRGFNQLNQASPFKRQLSLRVSDLPSNLERTRSYSLEPSDFSRIPKQPTQILANPPARPAPELPSSQNNVSAMCQQIVRGPSLFSSSDDFGPGISRTATSTVVRKLFTNTTTTTYLPGLINSRSLDDLKLQSDQSLGVVPWKLQKTHPCNKRERSPGKRMDRLRRSFRDSFRRRKDAPESSKPHQWHADECAVRSSTCAFHVKYLGCVEVYECRGMQVCEEALKVLRNSRRRPVRAILHVSGDGLRVVEDETKGLIVDQTIEKVSFCAPDRNHEKGFSYICRDGTTKRWMCHGFLALKESGERLSHAVGCAFAACLERKQRREKDCGVTMTIDQRNSTFTRIGSFRQPSLTERQQDSRERAVDVPPARQVYNPFAIERPHATPSMLERQGSFRGFNQLNQASPFKRQLSLRVSDLPSNLERTRSYSLEPSDFSRIPKQPTQILANPPARPAPELPSSQNNVSAMCQQIVRGPSLFSSSDDFGPGISRTATSTVVRKLFTNTTTTTYLPGLINSRSLDDLKLQSDQSLGVVVLSDNKNNNNDQNKPLGADGISCSLRPVPPRNSVNRPPAMNAVTSIFETPAASPVVSTESTSSLSRNPNAAYQQETTTSNTLLESQDANLASASLTPAATIPTPLTDIVGTSVNGLTDPNAVTTTMQPIPLSVAQGLPNTVNLQQPDPWLDNMMTQATSAVPPVFSDNPQQVPPQHAHALSLDSAAVPPTSPRTSVVDPFDAKWAEIAARNLRQATNTNPFLEPITAQAFQVQQWPEELQKSIADYYRNGV